MSSEDLQYYRQRALMERSRAMRAVTPEIGAIHGQLAKLYEDFIASLNPEGQALNASEPPPPQEPPQAQSSSGLQEDRRTG